MNGGGYMSFKPYRFGTALWYGLLLWIIGFIWGMIVFMVPTLKELPSIAYISKFPVISFPLIVLYAILLFFLSKRYLTSAEEKVIEGLKLGLTVFLVTVILDGIVYWLLFQGKDYFAFLSIWLSYAIFIIIPLLTGDWLKRKAKISQSA